MQNTRGFIMKNIKNVFNALTLAAMLAFSGTAFSYNTQEVNINTADAQIIAENLNGIGLKKAQAIVAWRTEHGNFTDASSIDQVKGIGQKTVEKNKEFIKY